MLKSVFLLNSKKKVLSHHLDLNPCSPDLEAETIFISFHFKSFLLSTGCVLMTGTTEDGQLLYVNLEVMILLQNWFPGQSHTQNITHTNCKMSFEALAV